MSVEYARDQAAQGKRSGKYRHIYGEPVKPEKQFLDIKNPLSSGEGSYVAANDKFFAVARASGGGPVYIIRLDKPGRQAANIPQLSVQKGKVLDMDFHPFISNMIATASEDCSVAVSTFPKTGLTKTISDAEIVLKGHGKKVVLCKFNPSANSVLASGSFDRTVKVWNIEKGEAISDFSAMKDNIYSLAWNKNGSQLACTSKDKKLYIFDPRTVDEVSSTAAFDGTKSSKVFWMPNLGWIGSCGFSKQAKRQIKFWDLKDLSKPIFSTNVDSAASVMMPEYDNDSGVLFTFGKGDGSISWAEVINDNKKLYPLGQYRSTSPQKGGGFVAKKGLNVWKCEIGRFLKLTKDSVIPIPLIVPRKAGGDQFQQDIYPDAFAGKPALTADDWAKGENKEPITMSLDPEKRDDAKEDDVQFEKKKTYEELEEENEKLRARVKELEAKLGIKSDDNDDDNNNDEQKEADNNDDNNDDNNNDDAGDNDDGGDNEDAGNDEPAAED